MYQNYIFDLYGTLVDIRTDESGDVFWGKVADIYKSHNADYTSDEIKDNYYHFAKCEKIKTRFAHPLYSHIEINLVNVFRKLYMKKGVTPTKEIISDTAVRFRKASTEFIKLYDGVTDLLQSLKDAGKNVYLLSNAQRCFTLPELEELDLVKYFDGIFISSDCACSKPGKQFFEKLINHYNLDKSKSIMIGNDCISDMQGAHDVGIDSLYIHQEISTPLEGHKLHCNYSVMDGDVTKIKGYVLNA